MAHTRPSTWLLGAQRRVLLRRMVVWLMQVVAVVLAAESSGAVHATLDLATFAGVIEHPADGCEQDGRECPPGCPTCHCAHGSVAQSIPLRTLLDQMIPPLPLGLNLAFAETLLPASPARARLDRPPRLTVLS